MPAADPTTPFTFEITYDPAESEAGSFLVLDEDHHVLSDPEWLSWLKRELGDNLLFVYEHRLWGSRVLCQWLRPPSQTGRPVAQELELYHPDSGETWPPSLMAPEVLFQRLRPIDEIAETRRRNLRAAEDLRLARHHETMERREDTISYLRKLGLRQEAHSLSIGATPFAIPDETVDWARTFNQMVRKS